MHVHSMPRRAVSGSIDSTSTTNPFGYHDGTVALRRFLDRREAGIPVQQSVQSEATARPLDGAPLARDIDEICDLVGISRTRFGRDAVGDPRLYYDLKNCGRRPGRDVRISILAHINHLAIEHAKGCKARAAMAQLARGR